MMRCLLHVQVLTLLLLACGAASAANDTPPDGIVVGRTVLQPYWATRLEFDDNVFRRCDYRDADCELGEFFAIESDFIHSLIFGLGTEMPVKNGSFGFDYEGYQSRYRDTGAGIGRNLTHDMVAELVMEFGTGDRLTLEDHYTLGATDLQVMDDIGGLSFRGVPYNFNRWSFELAREIPRMQGYQIKVTRLDMIFDAEECDPDDQECLTVPLFDYRGFQSVFQYRHPVPMDNWLIGFYEFRLLDNYTPKNKIPGAGGIESGSGVLFRTEHSNSYQIGFGGYMWDRHPFLIRAGLGRFRYTGLEPSESQFKGLVGHGRMRLNFGSRTELSISLDRRVLPSNFPTYYINNALRFEIDRTWLRFSKVGFRLNLSRNGYGDPIPGFCGDLIRKDNRWMVDAHMQWMIHRLIGLQVSASHWRRESNCSTSDYEANVISAGIGLGWN
jgi:hypothetical protein